MAHPDPVHVDMVEAGIRMSATDFIPLLLTVACIVSGIMAYVAKLALPGEDEYRSYRGADMLGRGRTDPDGPANEYDNDRRADRRYYANGSNTNRGTTRRASEGGFDGSAGSWSRSYAPPPPPPPPPREPDWWRVLDVPRTSEVGGIRRAYVKAMQAVHPDIVGNDALTSQRCADLSSAYEAGRKEAAARGRT